MVNLDEVGEIVWERIRKLKIFCGSLVQNSTQQATQPLYISISGLDFKSFGF